jgi:hypothetical protein
LSSNEITRAITGMEGSSHDRGGAADFETFERGTRDAADRILRSDGGNGNGGDGGTTTTKTPDYDSMDKEELLEECASRGMTTSFPKMKRIIIEELRFYDVHGR